MAGCDSTSHEHTRASSVNGQASSIAVSVEADSAATLPDASEPDTRRTWSSGNTALLGNDRDGGTRDSGFKVSDEGLLFSVRRNIAYGIARNPDLGRRALARPCWGRRWLGLL